MVSDISLIYLHQKLHLVSVYVQLLGQVAPLLTELSQLRAERSHSLIETHLNLWDKEKRRHVAHFQPFEKRGPTTSRGNALSYLQLRIPGC